MIQMRKERDVSKKRIAQIGTVDPNEAKNTRPSNARPEPID
jgi:hypothetical protein